MFQDAIGLELIKQLIILFRDGQIGLDEMWDVIERELQCHEFGDKCAGMPDICACHHQEISN